MQLKEKKKDVRKCLWGTCTTGLTFLQFCQHLRGLLMGSCCHFCLGPRMNTQEADLRPSLSDEPGPPRAAPQPESEPPSQVHPFSSVAQSCPTLCDPTDCSTPGFPVLHQLPEPTQTHIHRVSDAIQPSHPLSSPSLPAFNLSQHQGHFQWVSSLHLVAKVLEFQLQHQSFQWTFRSPLEWTGWISLQSKGLSRVFSYTTVQKHQFFGTQLSLQTNSHIHTRLLEKPYPQPNLQMPER